jgi:hypothetical protein
VTAASHFGPQCKALFDQLRQLGFIEGQNLTIDWRGYGARTEQFRDIAAELVKAKPDVIFCAGDIAVRAAQRLQPGAALPAAILQAVFTSTSARAFASPGDLNLPINSPFSSSSHSVSNFLMM